MTKTLAQQLDRVKLSIHAHDRSGPITVGWTSFDELRDKVAAMEAENAELEHERQVLEDTVFSQLTEMNLMKARINKLTATQPEESAEESRRE